MCWNRLSCHVTAIISCLLPRIDFWLNICSSSMVIFQARNYSFVETRFKGTLLCVHSRFVFNCKHSQTCEQRSSKGDKNYDNENLQSRVWLVDFGHILKLTNCRALFLCWFSKSDVFYLRTRRGRRLIDHSETLKQVQSSNISSTHIFYLDNCTASIKGALMNVILQ